MVPSEKKAQDWIFALVYSSSSSSDSIDSSKHPARGTMAMDYEDAKALKGRGRGWGRGRGQSLQTGPNQGKGKKKVR